MNSVQLLGNLARDPDIRFTKTGRPVARFTVACSRMYVPAGSTEQRELTDFIPCVAWGNLAENCGNHLAKGSRVFVQGRISVRSYETPDGQKRYQTEVVCDMVAQALGSDRQRPSAQPAMPPQPSRPGAGFSSMGTDAMDEEIPF